MEYSYKVTLSQFGTKLSGMFDILSKLLKEQKLQDFNRTRTTLEQVFLQFARFQINNKEYAKTAAEEHINRDVFGN